MKTKKLLLFGAVLLSLALGMSAMASADPGDGAGILETSSAPAESSGVLETPEPTESSESIAVTPTPTPATTNAAAVIDPVATTSVSTAGELFAADAVSYGDLVAVMSPSASKAGVRTFSSAAGTQVRYGYYIVTADGYSWTTLYRLNAITKRTNVPVVIAEVSEDGQFTYRGAGNSQGSEMSDVTPITIAKQG